MTLSTTKQFQIVNPKDFVIAALDMDNKTFMIHIDIKKPEEMPVNLEKQD